MLNNKVLLINKDGCNCVELPKNHNFKDIKRLLGITSPIDCVTRKIGDRYYDLWIDDNGLYKEDLIPVGMQKDYLELICNGILVAKSDQKGNTIGLTDEDIEYIKEYLMSIELFFEPSQRISYFDREITFFGGIEILVYDF